MPSLFLSNTWRKKEDDFSILIKSSFLTNKTYIRVQWQYLRIQPYHVNYVNRPYGTTFSSHFDNPKKSLKVLKKLKIIQKTVEKIVHVEYRVLANS